MPDAFLLQYSPGTYRIFDALQALSGKEKSLVLGIDNRRHPDLKAGSRVYLWESGGRDLVALGTVLAELKPREMPERQRPFLVDPGGHDPTEERVEIQVDVRLSEPISRRQLQQSSILSNANFFQNSANSQGSFFKVDPMAAQALDEFLEIGAQYFSATKDLREKALREVVIRQAADKFRISVLDAYDRRCAITECDVEGALEAAHIHRYADGGSDEVTNGLSLRADIHRLFDRHLISVRNDQTVSVAPHLQETSFGKELASLKLRLPRNPVHQPNPESLSSHREVHDQLDL